MWIKKIHMHDERKKGKKETLRTDFSAIFIFSDIHGLSQMAVLIWLCSDLYRAWNDIRFSKGAVKDIVPIG